MESVRLKMALTVAEGGGEGSVVQRGCVSIRRDEVPVLRWVDLGIFTYSQRKEMKPGEEDWGTQEQGGREGSRAEGRRGEERKERN